MFNRRQVIKGIGASAALAAASRNAPAFAQNRAFKIGILISEEDHDGEGQKLAPYDSQMRFGAELAIKEINETGGILGRPAELVIRDDFGSPAPGASAATSMVLDDGVEALVSGFIIAIRSFLTRTFADDPDLQVPVVHGFGTEGEFCGPLINHVGPTTRQSLIPVVGYLGDAASDRVFTISDWTPSQRIVSQQLQRMISPPLIALTGGALVTTPVEGYASGDFRDVVRWAANHDSNIVYVSVPRPYAVNAAIQAAEEGLADGMQFVFLDFSEHQARQLPDGMTVHTSIPFVASEDRPEVQDFVARLKAHSEQDLVTHVAYTHYNSIMAIKRAAEKSGDATSQGVKQGLRDLEFETATGQISLKDGYATMPMLVAEASNEGMNVVHRVDAQDPGEVAC